MKKNIYIYSSLCYMKEIDTTLHINYTSKKFFLKRNKPL